MKRTKKRIIHLGIMLVLIGLGVVGFLALTASKPQLKRTKPPIPMPMVRVSQIKTGPQSVTVRGEGTVKPLREIQLVPQVNGKVIFASPVLVDGGEFKKDDILLRIDPLDYQLAVTLARARVTDSESRLRVAEEEAAAAKEEWRLLYQDKGVAAEDPPALVAKEPQLAAARAKLAADRADLQKARLNLERTELKAPFNGRVSDESVDIGQYVSSAKPLATLFSTEAAEIIIPLDDESLFWFHVPGFTPGNGPGSPVKVLARIAGRELTWSGEVVRAEGKLDERTRMVNVVVHVEKPYARKPPLVSGLFATVEIQGRTLENAAVIPRAALRANNTVWVVDGNGQLVFRRVDVARLGTHQAILRSGLEDGELVVTSGLKVVTDGMRVRVMPSDKENKS
ncbi:MAG: efflux RND transporter periplasmic adaptor subunit [Deltaproteobacteria bacterium]|nr:efflux RND transporter periplasmic adaptor subunit [Deltaproteobacteria bacterium]MBW2656675.1 efflux RND transporter periplasmic adaptor subunit [Deltaproteobacteria bacterium]